MSERWKRTTIAECLAASFAGEWGADPVPGNTVVYRATDIDDEGRIVGAGAARRLPIGKLTSKMLKTGDILLEGSGGGPGKPVGRVAYFDSEAHGSPATCSNFFKTLRPSRDQVDPRFLLQKLFWFYKQPPILALQQQTTGIINLKFQEYLASQVEIPELVSEQAKIAEILDTLDTAIHETEALITKLKAVKQGLLHDLLTRGIDANGELRPPQSEAPHLYRLSPLGWIPTEWVVDSAGSILAGIDAGWSPSCPEEPPSEGEWGVLKVSAVSGGAYDARQSKRLPPNLRPILSIEVRVGDVLLARANGVADLVAKTVLVRDTPTKLMLSDKILRLVPNEKFVRSDYLVRIMMHAGTRSQINGMMNGSSGQRNISQSQIRSIIVPIPSIIEQAASMERLNELVGRLEGEMKILQKRKSLKHALMDDLLTGRVRVTPLLGAATA